jgi:4-hydroxy-2-oxoglutarate aldolase
MAATGTSLSGIFAPVTTPFRDGEVDLDGWRSNLAMYGASRLSGIVVLGSNGEAPLLDDEEADRLIAAARDSIGTGQWLVAGTGRESARATIQASRRAATLGVDAVMVRTPSFYKGRMTADALAAYYAQIADDSPVPVILYNVTIFTGVNLLPPTAIQLSAHPNIIGLKDSGGDVAVIAELAAGCPRGFGILAGSTAALYASLACGATGAVIGPAAVVPDLCVRVYEAVSAGRHEEARAAQSRLLPIARLVGPKYSVPGLKAAVESAGLVGGPPRSPLVPVPEDGLHEIREAVAALMQPA